MSHAPSNSRAITAPASRPKLRTVREEARNAILLEQLSYLLDHGGVCPDDCPDCARLRHVERLLLEPFAVEFYLPAPPAA